MIFSQVAGRLHHIHKKFCVTWFQVKRGKNEPWITMNESSGSMFIVLPTSPLPTHNCLQLGRDFTSHAAATFFHILCSKASTPISLFSHPSLTIPEVLSDGSLIPLGSQSPICSNRWQFPWTHPYRKGLYYSVAF